MDCIYTNDMIDEIGEGLIRKFDYSAYSSGQAVDIERFITDYLEYRIMYDRIAEEDAGKTAFLSDGKTSLCVWRNGKREWIVPPAKSIVVDSHFSNANMKTSLRFKLAHEAGHVLMNKLNGGQLTSAFSNEFDGERDYSIEELGKLFSLSELQATSMGVALLMPKNVVISAVCKSKGKKRIPVFGNSVLLKEDRRLLYEMSEHFEVSFKSLFYRLRDLKLFDYRLIDEYIAMNLGEIGGRI